MKNALSAALSAAVAAADPVTALRALVRSEPSFLPTALAAPLGGVRPPSALVVGAGKASASLAAEVLRQLAALHPPLPCAGGCLVVKDGHASPADAAALAAAGVALHYAAHPVPDARGEAGAAALLACLAAAPPGAAVIVCISGGASALLPLPVAGVTLGELQALSAALLASGAPIEDMNAVRKHLSRIAGGQLGVAAVAGTRGGPLLTLLVSDVLGDAATAIGSGPTVPDPTTRAQAAAILQRHGIALPPGAAAHLHPSSTASSETLKAALPNHTVRVLASNASAVRAAAAALQRCGYATHVSAAPLVGLAQEAAAHCAALLQQQQQQQQGGGAPLACVLGGETTVDLAQAQRAGLATGVGGRNTEMALAFGLAMQQQAQQQQAGRGGGGSGGAEWPELPWAAAFFATDGGDGPTDGAGAVVTAASPLGGEGGAGAAALRGHDAYTYFAALDEAHAGFVAGEGGTGMFLPGAQGGIIKCGPTGTNVCDVAILLLQPAAASLPA